MDCPKPAIGQLVNVNRHRLYVHCMGDANPGPAVLLEAALGSTSDQWAWIQPALASTMPVVAYDRAGLGWSEPGPKPRDARSIAMELYTALHNANVYGPFIVVGHSLGGLFVRVFADMFPDEVVGMVLVDATHPDQWTRLPDAVRMWRMISMLSKLGPWFARLGVFRLIDGSRLLDAASLPADARCSLRAQLARTQHWLAARDEVAVWETNTSTQARQTRWDARRPVAVMCAGETLRTIRGAESLQQELAELSSRGMRHVVAGATHMSIVTNKDFSQAVVRAVRQIALLSKSHSGRF